MELPSAGKLVRVPVEEGHTGASLNETQEERTMTPKLLWLKGTVSGQELPVLLDSGATVCCVAKRCVEASHELKTLPRKPYSGYGLLDANGEIITPSFVITAPIVMGRPAISLTVNFVVIDSLPYSCIIGLSLLSKLKQWSVDNERNFVKFNDAYIPVSPEPPSCNAITLVVPKRCTLAANQYTLI